MAARFCVFVATAILMGATAPLLASDVDQSADASANAAAPAATSDASSTSNGAPAPIDTSAGTSLGGGGDGTAASGGNQAPAATDATTDTPDATQDQPSLNSAISTLPPADQAMVQNAIQAAAPSKTTSDAASWAAGANPRCIREHESSGKYADDTGNGYYGAYQFNIPTWQSNGGGPGLPSSYPPAVQDQIAYNTWKERGWEPWTTCAPCGICCSTRSCNP
jgi:hypothetical protein